MLTLCCLLLRAQLDLGLVASFFQVGKLRRGAVQPFILQEQNLSSPPSTAGQELEEIPPFISRENSFK